MTKRTPSGTFKVRQRVYMARCVTPQWWWSYDVPVKVLRRIPIERSPYRGQDAYHVRLEDGYSPREVLCVPAEQLSAVAVSYPGLCWDEVLDARGVLRRRIAA